MNSILQQNIGVIILLCILPSWINAQDQYVRPEEKLLRHHIQVGYSMYNFADGNGYFTIIHRKNVKRTANLFSPFAARSQTARISYQFRISKPTSVYASFERINDGTLLPRPHTQGQVLTKKANYYSLSYQRNHTINEEWDIFGRIGGVHRKGSEWIFAAQATWEILLEYHDLKDWGIRAGIGAEYNFARRWCFTTELNYDRYLIVPQKGHAYLNSSGPSKNTFIGRFSIGFRF